MRKRLVVIAVAALVLIGAVAGWWYVSSQPGLSARLLAEIGLQSEAAPEGTLAASGIIEADEVSVTTETGGRVIEVIADEGGLVQEDDVVVRLDDALIQAQIAQAEAALVRPRQSWPR